MVACLSPNGAAVSQSDGPPSHIFIATWKGIRQLERTSSTTAPWRQISAALHDVHISSIAPDASSGRLFAGSHWQGVYTSDDHGRTWQRSVDGHAFALAAHPSNGVIFAGLAPSALLRSRDSGAHWERIEFNAAADRGKWSFMPLYPHHVKNLVFHPGDPRVVFACVEQGALLKSLDNGDTWSEITTCWHASDRFYHDAHRLIISEKNPDLMYLTTGDGLRYTTDGARTWSRLTSASGHRIGYPDSVFFDPADDGTLYLAGAEDNPGAWTEETANPAIMRSHDGGHTWTEIMSGLPRPIRGSIEAMSLHIDSERTTFFVGTAVGQVYASEDRGASWTCIAEGLPPITKAGHFRRFLPNDVRERTENELAALMAGSA